MKCPKCDAFPMFANSNKIVSLKIDNTGASLAFNMICSKCSHEYVYSRNIDNELYHAIVMRATCELNDSISESMLMQCGNDAMAKVLVEIEHLNNTDSKFVVDRNWFCNKCSLHSETIKPILEKLCKENKLKHMYQVSCPECESGLNIVENAYDCSRIEECDICDYDGDEWDIRDVYKSARKEGM